MISSDINLKEQIHNDLFSDIVNGVYLPGAVLHEKTLMEKYGVSRAPVREALIQLCSEEILRNYPKRGYELTAVSAEEIQNIMRYRITLECGFMQQSGHLIDSSLIGQLKEHIELHENSQKGKNGKGFTALEHWQNNIDFHLLLFSNYKNNYAYRRLQEAMAIQTRYYAQKRSEQWHSPIFYDANGLHMAIVDYLEKKNYSMASNILKADIEDTTTM